LPVAGGLAGAPVNDELLGFFGDLRIEIVLQHPKGGLLDPALAAQGGAPSRANGTRGSDRRHGKSIASYSSFAASDRTGGLSRKLRARSMSSDRIRSRRQAGTTRRNARRTGSKRGEVRSGRKNSIAWIAVKSSMARTHSRFSTTAANFRAAMEDID